MGPDCFASFESANYPCYWLGDDGLFLMNEAAKAAAPPLCEESAMRRILQASLQERRQNSELPAHTLPLLTDALSMRTLTLMPHDGGILAIACDEQVAPVNAFSSAMREPLANIFASLPLLNARLDGIDERYVEDVQANCYRLLRVASNIEIGSRVETRLFDLQPVDGTALTESLCVSVNSVCKRQGVSIEWDLPKDPLPVRANPSLLSDAFLNLIRNSLQFTRDGNHIRITLSQVGKNSLLTVEDRGLGIKPEYVDRIFEPYFSVDPYGDSNLRPGLGLGLSVVQQTVAGFGGNVKAESAFGEGTRIYCTIPLDTSGGELLGSDAAEYMLNRFSPLYVQLCGYCLLPKL
ncbi:HAMP domain-containing histidine kinase [Ruminococcaceae bacterium OttesenSCG-928-D13]|nr:HAMP domain-containing histidine kinase [Ruminococcaceae bacterium OttesenSCG-928-D13]